MTLTFIGYKMNKQITVLIDGALGSKFGTKFKVKATSPADAIQFLCAQIPGFKEYIGVGAYHIVSSSTDDLYEYATEEINMSFGKADTLRIIPSIVGEGFFSGLRKIVLGVALVFVAVVALPAIIGTGAIAGYLASNVIGIGTTLALFGVAEIFGLLPDPLNTDRPGRSNEENSSILNGPENLKGQGHAIAITVGHYLMGSNVIESDNVSEYNLIAPNFSISRGADMVPNSSGGTGTSAGAGESGGYKGTTGKKASVGRQQLGIKKGTGSVTRGGDRGSGGSGRGASGGNPAGTTGSGAGGFSR